MKEELLKLAERVEMSKAEARHELEYYGDVPKAVAYLIEAIDAVALALRALAKEK